MDLPDEAYGRPKSLSDGDTTQTMDQTMDEPTMAICGSSLSLHDNPPEANKHIHIVRIISYLTPNRTNSMQTYITTRQIKINQSRIQNVIILFAYIYTNTYIYDKASIESLCTNNFNQQQPVFFLPPIDIPGFITSGLLLMSPVFSLLSFSLKCFLISLAIVKNACSTFVAHFALVSRKFSFVPSAYSFAVV